jgi:hypothetical protein
MKNRPPFLRQVLFSVSTSALWFFLPPACASDLLFDDQFGEALSPPQEATSDINVNLSARQNGSLAPSPYSMSKMGDTWQFQVNPDIGANRNAMNFRMYPTGNIWYGFSPSWELKNEDGHYELSVTMLFLTAGQAFLKTAVALGRVEPTPEEAKHLDLSGVFEVVIEDTPLEMGSEPLLNVLNNGDEVASVPLSPEQMSRFKLTLKWTTKNMEISDMEILIDGNKIPVDCGAAMKLNSRRIMIGVQGETFGNSISAIQFEQLSYTKN